jgi:glycosyltransferase involved in cell wall biosynthesis
MSSEVKKQTISLCMMVKDEEECLERALDNVIGHFDEIIIEDTGSTDRTIEIIAAYKQKHPDLIKFSEHPFNGDFSYHRNRLIEKAAGDWIFVFDADETLEKELLVNLHRLIENEFYDIYAFNRKTRINERLANIFDFDFHPRFFKNNGDITYRNKVHEELVGYHNLQLTNLVINHDKKHEWQIEDDKRLWDAGQQPPPGWRKVDGNWAYFRSTREHPHYHYPDKSGWNADDKRCQLNQFDAEAFRHWYNNYNKEYGSVDNIALSPKERALENLIVAHDKRETGIDIGCGSGKFVAALVKNEIIGKGTGVDISNLMIEQSHETFRLNNVEVELIRTSLEEWQTDRTFDIIVCTDVLEHIFSLRDMLVKIRNLLNPGGLFVGSVPLLHTCDCEVHLHYFTHNGLRDLLVHYFSEVEIKQVDQTGQGEIHLIFRGNR